MTHESANANLPDLADSAPCGLISVAPDGRILSANREFLRWIGKTSEDVVGKLRFTDVLSEGARVFFEAHLLPKLHIGGRLDETVFHILRPQTGRWDVVLSGQLTDSKGTATFALYPAEHRRNYERQQSSMRVAAEAEVNWLKQIEALGRVGAWSYSPGDNSLQWSEQLFKLHDLPTGKAPGIDEATSYLATDALRREWRDALAAAAADGTPFDLDAALISGAGHRKFVRIRGQAEWMHGRIRRVVGIYADRTEQRLAEAERDIAEKRLLGLAKNLPGVLMSFEVDRDRKTRILFISDRCKDIWGYEASDFIEAPALLDGTAAADAPTGLVDALRAADEGAIDGRFKFTSRGGATKWIDLHGIVTRTSPDRVHGDCMLLDVTREVLAETELASLTTIAQRAQKNESIGKLTGGVAHDFNNLLAIIMGNLELLREEVPGDFTQFIDAALDATRRGAGLTKSMLAFGRRSRLTPKIFDVNDVVRSTTDWTVRTLPATISVQLSLADRELRVRADFDLAASALLNLIINARDAMPEGGRITISTSKQTIDEKHAGVALGEISAGNYVVLSVDDTGTGIPENELSKIFEPFYTTKPPGSGSGLGLSMVYGFMQQSGGAVRVRSAQGSGTTIELYFPAILEAVSSEPANVPHPPLLPRRARILIVEDEVDVLASMNRTLRSAGYDTATARSGDAAAALFSQDPAIDLLLTDFVMPGTLQGDDLAKTLRSIRPGLPVVFCTGYANTAMSDRGGIAPEDSLLVKPASRSELLRVVSAALARSQSIRLADARTD